MTHTRTATTTIRLLLMVIATTALAVGLAFASPASAQFVDQDEADTAPADEQEAPADEQQAPVDDAGGDETGEAQEAAPSGGVDAGFGGAAEQGAGLGVPHVLALAILGVAIAGHVASRRAAPVRA